jgi:hypothetical protein
MRMLRREPGREFGKGNRSVHYDAAAEKGRLDIHTHIDIERDIELFFEIVGDGLTKEMIKSGIWKLPGCEIKMETCAACTVLEKEGGLEVVYLSAYKKDGREREMNFKLQFTKL